jgi:lipoprotein NlpD
MKNGSLISFLGWSFFILIGLSACSSEQENYAPVTDGWSSRSASNTYRVQPDDTLYSIAFRFGADYRKLASMNNLTPPYHLTEGQNLVLSSTGGTPVLSTTSDEVVTGAAPESTVISQPVSTSPVSSVPLNVPSTLSAGVKTGKTLPVITTPVQPVSIPATASPSGKWLWPVNGKVITHYSAAYGGSKGIDIAGSLGTPVIATAAGKVVYSGTGLKGYGLLIIIKHNAEYLSAYAHNSKAFVKEGDSIAAGQKIALMGSSGASKVLLHFEVRKAGKPIDPLSMLPAK